MSSFSIIDDDDIEALLVDNQVIINDKVDPILVRVKREIDGGAIPSFNDLAHVEGAVSGRLPIEALPIHFRSSKYYEFFEVVGMSVLPRFMALYSAAVVMILWKARHTPVSRDVPAAAFVAMLEGIRAVYCGSMMRSIFSLGYIASSGKWGSFVLQRHFEDSGGSALVATKDVGHIAISAVLHSCAAALLWVGAGES
jgi:hypothetical protein